MIALPNLLFVSALLFAVGALTRKLFAVYITGIVLLVVWQITQQIVGQLDRLSLAALIDPFAITTTQVAIRYWSVAEKNTRLIPFDGAMLQNRLLWIAIALALFALVAAVFRLRLQQRRGAAQEGEPTRSARRRRAADAGGRRCATTRRSVAARVRVGRASSILRSIVREAPFLAISAICVINLHGRRVVHVAPRRLGASGR